MFTQPSIVRAAPRPTAAQARASLAAKHAIEDFIVCFPVEDVARVIADALLEAHGPAAVERIGNEIGRRAHIAGRS